MKHVDRWNRECNLVWMILENANEESDTPPVLFPRIKNHDIVAHHLITAIDLGIVAQVNVTDSTILSSQVPLDGDCF